MLDNLKESGTSLRKRNLILGLPYLNTTDTRLAVCFIRKHYLTVFDTGQVKLGTTNTKVSERIHASL